MIKMNNNKNIFIFIILAIALLLMLMLFVLTSVKEEAQKESGEEMVLEELVPEIPLASLCLISETGFYQVEDKNVGEVFLPTYNYYKCDNMIAVTFRENG